jgi:cell division protein FtsQ
MSRARIKRKQPVAADEAMRPSEPPPEPVQKSIGAGALKFLLGIGLVAVAASGVALGAHRFLTTTTRFGIEGVEARGSQRYNDAELLSLAGIRRGANLFSVDLVAAERKLAEDPWIESAHVARKLPDRLTITVEELSAAALAVVDGTIYLVTRQGRPIKPLEAGDFGDYAVVTGVTAEQLATDRQLAEERIAAGIDVLDYYRRVGLSQSFPAQEVLMDADGRLELTVGTPPITLQLGKADYRQKLLMAGRIVGTLRSKGETPGIIFLDNEAHPERVVVRMH